MQQHAPGNKDWSWLIYPVACALVVIGAKCWMIARYGNPIPFWDQWDAEGAILYPRFFDGTLRLSDLLAAHNEHRILLTRLWSLLLLELEGYWDPILQMTANTLLLGGFVGLFITAFRPVLARTPWLAFAAFATIMFALPFGWENTLAGFNSQWYFVLLTGVSGLVAIVAAAAFSPCWWIGFLLLVVSYFCTAAGALSMSAGFAVSLMQFAAGPRRGKRELLALALLAMAAAAMVGDIPALAHHVPLKAHSVTEFLRSAIRIASWPAALGPVPAILQLFCALLINAPAAAASIRVIRQRPPIADRQWLLPALAGWSVLQMAAIAYGRATVPTNSRYFDLFLIGVLLNGASLLYLVTTWRDSWLRGRRGLAAVALWLLLIGPGSAATTVWQSIHTLPILANAWQAEIENMRAFLVTNDRRVLENKPPLDIPYPDANRLAAIASMPVVRAILPPALVGEASAARAQQRGLARFTGRPIEALKTFALRWGMLLIPTGLALFLLGLSMGWWRDAQTSPSTARPD